MKTLRFRYLHLPFYFGLSILFIGILFKIQHWEGGEFMIWGGLGLLVVFFIMTLFEILTSKKARRKSKLTWAASYLLLPIVIFLFLPKLFCAFGLLIVGTIYLGGVRRLFITSRRDFDNITFDSIKIDKL